MAVRLSQDLITAISVIGFGAVGLYADLAVKHSAAIAAANTGGNFTDTRNYWAQPFIQSLAQANIVDGYPDGTYRPDRPVTRDEFAAIIRKAFNQPAERQIASGSSYRDVPQGYWAAPAIKEAYEQGFMRGYPGGYFRPKQPVSRVEALVSLVNNMDLRTAAQKQAQQSANASNQTATTQANAAQPTARPRRQIFLPLAGLAMMQPLLRAIPAPAAQAANPTAQTTNKAQTNKAQTFAAQTPAPINLKDYYNDADQIPQYAVQKVEAATRAGLVVNYPRKKFLKPNQAATRGDIAAFIHQALVTQGNLQPLPNDLGSTRYIVNENAADNLKTQNEQSKK